MKRVIFTLVVFMFVLAFGCRATSEKVPTVHLAQLGNEQIQVLDNIEKLDVSQYQRGTIYLMKKPSYEDNIKAVSEILSVDISNEKETTMIDSKLGFWVYSLDDMASPADMPNLNDMQNLPPDEEAIEIATRFIKGNNLYNGDLGEPRISLTTSGDSITNNLMILKKNIYFYPKIDGKDVYGIFRISIGVGANGKIVNVIKQVHEIEEFATVSLKTNADVAKDLSDGNYIALNDSFLMDTSIDQCRLIFYSDAQLHGDNLYVFPVYEIIASGFTEDEKVEQFSILVDAVSKNRE